MKKRLGIFLSITMVLIYIINVYDISRIKILNSGKYDYIYLAKKEGDSLERYNYIFGSKEMEVYKSILDNDSKLPTSEITSYYRNGNVMSYRFYIDKCLTYYRHYNDEGVTIKYDGNGILYPSDSIYEKNISLNTYYTNNFKFVNPPNIERILFVGKYVDNEEERDYDVSPLHEVSIENSTFYYDIMYENPGEYKDVLYLLIRDTVSNDIEDEKIVFKYILE